MTKETLMKLNKSALVEMVLKLQEENKLIKEEHKVYECMDCCKQFEDAENGACPYCGSGDICSY